MCRPPIYLAIILLIAPLSAKASSDNNACYEIPAAEAAEVILGASHEINSLGINPEDMSIISVCKKLTRTYEIHRSYIETDTYVFEFTTSANNLIKLIINKITRCANDMKVTYWVSVGN